MHITLPTYKISSFTDTDSCLLIYQCIVVDSCYHFSYVLPSQGCQCNYFHVQGERELKLPGIFTEKKYLCNQGCSHDTTVWC